MRKNESDNQKEAGKAEKIARIQEIEKMRVVDLRAVVERNLHFDELFLKRMEELVAQLKKSKTLVENELNFLPIFPSIFEIS